MRLLRLYIINSGLFKKNIIEFTDKSGNPQDLICLAGVNGTGKTTIMELISNLMLFLNPKLTLQDIFIDRFKPNVLSRTEFAQLDILIDGKILSLVLGDETNIQQTEKYQQMFVIEPEIAHLIKEIEEVVKSLESNEHGTIKRQEYFEKEIYNRKSTLKNSQLFEELFKLIESSIGKPLAQYKKLPILYFFNAHDREILDLRYSSIPEYKPIYEVVQIYHPKKDDLKKRLIYYDYAYTQAFEKIKDWINANVLQDKVIDRIDRPEFKVVIKKDNEEHGLELLSSGEESLLLMAIQLYFNASKNAVILIDEVDQSLHPQYQERVMQIIKKIQQEKNCQLIVSSHSEFIWNEFKEKAIIDLTKR